MTADEAYDRLHGLDGCAQSPARALRDAALFFEREMAKAWGGDAEWLTTGTRVAGVVADALREEAADLDAERIAGVLKDLEGTKAPAVTPRYTSDDASLIGHDFGRLETYVAEYVNDSPAALRVRLTETQQAALEMARKADAAERRAEDTEAAFEQLRSAADKVGHQAACPVDPCDCWMRDLAPLLDYETEGVGTGAGEGATGQDTGTAWVTRSEDCPEAPAQAHPLATAALRERVEALLRECKANPDALVPNYATVGTLCRLLDDEGDDHCDHEWLDRPESDTRVCELCAEER